MIAVSHHVKRDVLEVYPAVDPERIEVIYNGVDVEEYAPDTGTDVLEKYGIDADAPTVVFVGRITHQKGVPHLLERGRAALHPRDGVRLPSIYEPQRIVNLEAMACETAVVASATGGIIEVVDDGVTGLLVRLDRASDGSFEPRDPAAFAAGFADRVNELVCDPQRAADMGRAGRQRAVEHFSWDVSAARRPSCTGGFPPSRSSR